MRVRRGLTVGFRTLGLVLIGFKRTVVRSIFQRALKGQPRVRFIGSGFRVRGLRVSGWRFRVEALGCRVEDALGSFELKACLASSAVIIESSALIAGARLVALNPAKCALLQRL